MTESTSKIEFKNIIHQHNIILGDVNSGKTYNCFLFVLFLLKNQYFKANEISLIDFGPPSIIKGKLKIGGTFREIFNEIKKKHEIPNTINQVQWLEPPNGMEIAMPRTLGTTKQEVIELAFTNYQLCSNLINEYKKKPTQVLLINDISIFLHIGKVEKLLEIITHADTFLGNSYVGKSLIDDKSSGISLQEIEAIKQMKEIIKPIYL